MINLSIFILKEYIPALLSMAYTIDNGLDSSKQGLHASLCLRHHTQRLENYFLIHCRGPVDTDFAFHSKKELWTLYSTFEHPSVKALESLLPRADRPTYDKTTVNILEKVWKDCNICAEFAASLRLYKYIDRFEDLRLNIRVQVDTMFLSGRPVIIMIDEPAHFRTASFLRNPSTSEIWRSIPQMSSLANVDPPQNFLKEDQGLACSSKNMRETVKEFGVLLEEAAVEKPGAISVGERYHGSLRLTYERIRADTDHHLSEKNCAYNTQHSQSIEPWDRKDFFALV